MTAKSKNVASVDDHRRQGMLLLLGAAFFFSLMAVQVKLLGAQLPSTVIVLGRAIVTLVLSVFMLKRAGTPFLGQRRGLLLLRGVFGFIGLLCFFFAITKLPLAEASVLFSLNPVFTAVLAAIFLKEALRPSLMLALVVAFSGVLLVVRPASLFGEWLGEASDVVLDPYGVAACLVGSVAAASAYTLVRKLRTTEDPLVIVFYFSFVATPASLPFALQSWVWPDAKGWLLLLGVGLATQTAQVLMTKGIASVPAGPATTVGYSQVAIATLWGVLFFDEVPTWGTAMGALLIISALVGLAMKKT
ncbi:MAG: DMT family transporter [Deltaproteobacteria bacterium]|nr:DMT family transporter [Deltaproteobacteria bacterium]